MFHTKKGIPPFSRLSAVRLLMYIVTLELYRMSVWLNSLTVPLRHASMSPIIYIFKRNMSTVYRNFIFMLFTKYKIFKISHQKPNNHGLVLAVDERIFAL